MDMTPKFMQGVFAFTGTGLSSFALLSAELVYSAPADKRAQLIYFRAGNASAELVCFSLVRDGKMMRLFPVGAKADSHVSLAVVEDLMPDTKLEVFIAAPEGTEGMVVVDVGLVEI